MVKKPAPAAGQRPAAKARLRRTDSAKRTPPKGLRQKDGGQGRTGADRGEQARNPRQPLRRTGISSRSITAMVVGICSLPLLIPIPLPGIIPGLGFILGIVATILAAIELKADTNGQMDPRSRGFAIAGMVTGIMGVVTGIFIIIIFGAVIIPAIYTALAQAVTTLQGGQVPIPQ